MRKLFCVFGVFLAYYSIHADIYDVYGLGQVRDTLPLDVQCLLAEYLLPHVTLSFLFKLKKDIIWKPTCVTCIQTRTNTNHSGKNMLDKGVCIVTIIGSRSDYPLKVEAPQENYNSHEDIWYAYRSTFYLKRRTSHILEIKHVDQYKTDDCVGTISYAPGTVFESFLLEQDTLKVHVVVGTEEHTWEPSKNLEDYVPGKRITLEQVLFLMLLENVHTNNKKGASNLEFLIHDYRESLGKHIPNSSMLSIITYLRSILKSFGPLVEPLIIEYYIFECKT